MAISEVMDIRVDRLISACEWAMLPAHPDVKLARHEKAMAVKWETHAAITALEATVADQRDQIERLTQRAESAESDLKHNARNHSFQAKSSEDIIVALHEEIDRLTAYQVELRAEFTRLAELRRDIVVVLVNDDLDDDSTVEQINVLVCASLDPLIPAPDAPQEVGR